MGFRIGVQAWGFRLGVPGMGVQAWVFRLEFPSGLGIGPGVLAWVSGLGFWFGVLA